MSEDDVRMKGSLSSVLQLRYLQALNSISAENNSTVVFPVPIDIFSFFAQRRKVTFSIEIF